MSEQTDGFTMQKTEKKQSRLLKIGGPLLVFLSAFLIGILIFLPTGELAEIALKYLARSGTRIETGSINPALNGSFTAESVEIPHPEDETRIALVEGDVDTTEILFSDRLKMQVKLTGLTVKRGALKIGGGIWNLKADINGVSKNRSQWKGSLSLKGQGMMINYLEPVPMLNTTITARVLSLEGNFALDRNRVNIQRLQAVSDLAEIIVQGQASLVQNGPLNLEVAVIPTKNFYEKYKEQGVRQVLEAFGILQADGRIQLQVQGTTANPSVKPVKAVQQAPAVTP